MPPTTASKALLELNGLVLMKYSSIYGTAYEVLTQDGKHRICFGQDEEETLKKAVEYLEAKAVLTGKPMKTPRTRPSDDHIDATRYAMQQAAKLKILEEMMKERNVRTQPKFFAVNQELLGSSRLLDPFAAVEFDFSGPSAPEPKKEE